MRGLLSFLVLGLVAYAAICLLVWVFQRRLTYFPSKGLARTPADVGLAAEELAVTTSDGVTLHGWRFPNEDAVGELVYCHGNAGNVADRLVHTEAFLEMGLAVTLFDWRGYGRSEGSPSEEGLYRDVDAVWRWLVQEAGVAPGRLVVYGESLGGGPAIELATEREIGALVLEACFTSLPDLGADVYPWLPVRPLARERYASEEKLAEIDVPVLVVHSPADEIVPFSHAEALAAAAPHAELLATEAGHNDGGFLRRPRWRERVETFVHSALGADRRASSE